MSKLKLQIVVGSTREGRAADPVLRWLEPVARAHPAFDVEVLDLRDWPLPHFRETFQTIGDLKDPTYSDPQVRRWNQKIREGDAYLLITPEYNHSTSGVLKNAIDSVFVSFGFRHKPVAFVGYSNGVAAGVRAVEHLVQIMVEAEAVPVRTQTLIPQVLAAFDANGKPVQPATEIGFGIMLDDLAWLAKPLKAARAEGEAPPPTMRLRAALAARAPK